MLPASMEKKISFFIHRQTTSKLLCSVTLLGFVSRHVVPVHPFYVSMRQALAGCCGFENNTARNDDESCSWKPRINLLQYYWQINALAFVEHIVK